MMTTASLPGTYWYWQNQAIYYVASGDMALPPMILVHGFGASTDHWRKNIIELQQHFRVFAIDLLGFGRSAKPALEYSASLWQSQLEAFVREVVQRSAFLAGNSLGGYVSLCLAANCPDLVEGLILLNSAGPFTEPVVTTSKPNPLRAAVQKVLQQSWASNLLFLYLRQPWVIRRTLKQVYCDHAAVTQQLIAEIRRPALDPGAAQVFASVFQSRQGEKVDQLLEKLRAPLLLLWGERDPWINARDRNQKFFRHYPQSEAHFLNAGHCPHDEVPELVNPLIVNWGKAFTT
ncbi:MAG: alpha/beta fold hydrolase [Cyanobacteria bacterium P01_H01_bin.15]